MSETKHTPISDILKMQWIGNTTMQIEFNPETFLGYSIVAESLFSALHSHDKLKRDRDMLLEALSNAEFLLRQVATNWKEAGSMVDSFKNASILARAAIAAAESKE
jgi:hypothetical protein